MISQLREQQALGNTSENGFKSTVWVTIGQSFPADSRKREGRVIESKWSRLKKDYKEVKFLLDCSGLGWNAQRCVDYLLAVAGPSRDLLVLNGTKNFHLLLPFLPSLPPSSSLSLRLCCKIDFTFFSTNPRPSFSIW